MPAAQLKKAPPSPTTLARDTDDGDLDRHTQQHKTEMTELELVDPPTSPRVRRRLSDAKENASIFQPVCEQGEVIQWMSACHPDLISFGRELERRGFKTLSSIAFLTEDDMDLVVEPETRQLLMATLSRLRHEFFRM